jgi:purine nucleosidase
MRVWLDTDLGSDVDDALTLAYVLAHPELQLVGVSTVFGDVALRTRITEAMLALAGVSVPVVTGLGCPLTPGREGRMFGHEGRGILADAAPVMIVESDPEADRVVARLESELADAQADVVVAIGPLTNLGALAQRGVALPRLAIMGGKIQDVMLPGMIPQVPEWNWYCDPVAVQQVLDASLPAPARVVPAEVTFRTALAEGDVERLGTGSEINQALAALCTEWLRFQVEGFKSAQPRVALHDPLTAATLVESGLCPFQLERIRVDARGGSEILEGEANIEVATDVDPARVREHLMETWLAAR